MKYWHASWLERIPPLLCTAFKVQLFVLSGVTSILRCINGAHVAYFPLRAAAVWWLVTWKGLWSQRFRVGAGAAAECAVAPTPARGVTVSCDDVTVVGCWLLRVNLYACTDEANGASGETERKEVMFTSCLYVSLWPV